MDIIYNGKLTEVENLPRKKVKLTIQAYNCIVNPGRRPRELTDDKTLTFEFAPNFNSTPEVGKLIELTIMKSGEERYQLQLKDGKGELVYRDSRFRRGEEVFMGMFGPTYSGGKVWNAERAAQELAKEVRKDGATAP